MANGRITLKDIYEVVNRLEEKMDKRMCRVEERVDILEDFKSKILGIVTIVSLVSGAVFSWFWEKVTKKI
jgi:hypothetical protein